MLIINLVLFYVLFFTCNSLDEEFNECDVELYDDVGFDDVELFDEGAMKSIVQKVNQISIGNPNPKVGDRLDVWSPYSDVNPEELGTYYQGDILNPRYDEENRNGVIGDAFRWPGATVYFRITGKFTPRQLRDILRAMSQIESTTCVKFRYYTGKERDFVSIGDDHSGCWATLGRSTGEQHLNLQTPNCFRRFGTLIHELLHVVGFTHEQSRTERDSFVYINWGNIREDAIGNFDKDKTHAFGIPYDYGSVMHYSAFAFALNKTVPTIIKKKRGAVIGQRIRLSQLDIYKIRAMYKCKGRTSYLN